MALSRSGANWVNEKFIPELYAKKVLNRFYATDVLNGVTNMDYSAEFSKKGDTVHIRREPKFTPVDHLVDAPFAFETVNDEEVLLSIDYDKVTAARIPYEDMTLSDIDLENMVIESMKKAHTKMVQQVVFQGVSSSATSTVTSLDWQTALNPTKAIGSAQVALDNLEVDQDGRWLLLSPAMANKLAQEATLYAQNMGTPKGALFDGYVGHYNGFDIYKTPYLAGAGTSGSPWYALAGHKSAISMATKIQNAKMVDLAASGYLGMGIVFQTLFGFQVSQPDALVSLRAQTA
jgi:hypothetical protein